MQSDEARALHIPVGLFALRLEVNAIGQPPVEQVCDLGPGLGRNVVLGGKEPALVGVTSSAGARLPVQWWCGLRNHGIDSSAEYGSAESLHGAAEPNL